MNNIYIISDCLSQVKNGRWGQRPVGCTLRTNHLSAIQPQRVVFVCDIPIFV